MDEFEHWNGQQCLLQRCAVAELLVLAPSLLSPNQADRQVQDAQQRVVALHGGDELAVGQVPVLHVAAGACELRLRDLRQLPALRGGHDGDQLGLCVVASGFNLLVVLDDHAVDVVGGRIRQHIVSVHVVKGRDDDPSCFFGLRFVAISLKGLEVQCVAEVTFQGQVLTVL